MKTKKIIIKTSNQKYPIYIGKNVIDLLFHLPHTVINRLNNLDLKHCPTNSIITKKILITKHISNFYNSKRPYKLIGHCENFEIEIVFFNYKGQYIEKNFPVNSVVIVSGKINRFKITMNNIFKPHIPYRF